MANSHGNYENNLERASKKFTEHLSPRLYFEYTDPHGTIDMQCERGINCSDTDGLLWEEDSNGVYSTIGLEGSKENASGKILLNFNKQDAIVMRDFFDEIIKDFERRE